jgi:hypothetical protein
MDFLYNRVFPHLKLLLEMSKVPQV